MQQDGNLLLMVPRVKIIKLSAMVIWDDLLDEEGWHTKVLFDLQN